MATTPLQRQHMIRQAVLQAPGPLVATTRQLWQSLAHELISIIGEGGFQSMYVRSLHLAAERFAFLPHPSPSASNAVPEQRFDSLIESLQACAAATATSIDQHGTEGDPAFEASITLFCIFIDILALLIGEHLTSSILRSAWGNAALDLAEKETHQ